MSTAEVKQAKTSYTPEDLLALADGHAYELVEGQRVVNPNTRTVLVYRKDQVSVAFLHEQDELSGEDVLPGFRCPVRDVFPPVKNTPP